MNEYNEIAVDAALRRTLAKTPKTRPGDAQTLATEVERLRAVSEKQQWRITSLQQDMRTIMNVTRWEQQAHQIAKRALKD